MAAEAAPLWVAEQLERSPVRRLRQKHFRTLTAFQKATGLSKPVIYYTELGCYNKLPGPYFTAFKARSADIDPVLLEYQLFRTESRKIFGKLFIKPNLEYLTERMREPALYESISPVLHFRELLNLSRSELAKGMCIQTSTLLRSETGASLEFGRDLYGAFRAIGIPGPTVREWDEYARKYAATK